MNLLKHHIKEVISVNVIPPEEWMTEPYVSVTIKVNCYGVEEEYSRWFSQEEWKHVKEQGYFMA